MHVRAAFWTRCSISVNFNFAVTAARLSSRGHEGGEASLFGAAVLGRVRLVLEDLVNTITHLLNGFAATDKYTSIQPIRKNREKIHLISCASSVSFFFIPLAFLSRSSSSGSSRACCEASWWSTVRRSFCSSKSWILAM